MARTPATTTPVIEAIDSQRNGVGGTPFYSAILTAEIDGRQHRFLAQFAVKKDPETGEITEIAKDADGGLIAFVIDFNAAIDGNLAPFRWRGDKMVAEWLPVLREALAAKEAADEARRNQEHEELMARTLATINDLLTRTKLPLTEEYITAARAVVWPGITRVEDSELRTYKTAIKDKAQQLRDEK